ncbi:unnamed protein product [Clonostachys chloroleuca]|uniref:Uncharacterized protein n=1 Tax=Clonostachys chloroleuca TaxID=1926264 RepID=A0AA35VV45_9HYPO|nr:unnamed protein product [Clonostachys chloroleuca]
MACSNFTSTTLPHFSTAALIDITKKLNETCPLDLVDGNGIKVDVANTLFQGENSFFETLGPWSPYAAAIIFSRLIDFKLPLLQLISQLPRPRYTHGWLGQAFAIFHLIADPVDSMSSYLFTLASCKAVLQRTKEKMRRERGPEADERFERRCTLIALVYETGHHSAAFKAMGLALAADRGSNFWAVGVAIFGFFMAVILKYVYIDTDTFDVTKPQHIDIWSISSSLCMVHIIPNVLFASIISVQQSHYTARRILQEFEQRINREDAEGGGAQPRHHQIGKGDQWEQDEQINNGVIPNWRPNRQHALELGPVLTYPPWVLDVVSFLIVITPSAGAMWLASMVPPEGFNCRTVVKLIMMSLYVVKYAAQLLVNRLSARSTTTKMFITAAMDIMTTILFAFVIFSTQSGILNRPGCYRQCKDNGECGIYPASVTWNTVQKGLHGLYSGILFGFLSMQLVFCALMVWVFWDARKVYLQDDKPLEDREDELQPLGH